MAPIKSSLARTVGKLLGVQKDTDLSLRGHVQSTRALDAPISLSGGTITAGITPGDGYTYFAFISSGDLTVTGGSGTVDFLVIGGGGGAGAGDPGNNASAGSGAGGVARGLNVPISAGTIPITVGQGGAGCPAPRSSQASNGGDSKFGAPGEPWYALAHGGGYGSSQSSGGDYPGGTGGSGGGGATPGGGGPGPAEQPGTNPSPLITDFGFAGGSGGVSPGGWGGGGGAGSVGGDYSSGEGGNGGNGAPFTEFPAPKVQPLIPSPIRPAWTPAVGPTGLYAGGGGGGVWSGSGTPSGGPGGGGGEDTQGVDYTGSGSGGSPANEGAGHRGAHGIVLIRYQAS